MSDARMYKGFMALLCGLWLVAPQSVWAMQKAQLSPKAGSLLAGVYTGLGYMVGYYHYEERDENGGFVMSQNSPSFGLSGELGVVNARGFRLDSRLDVSYNLGIYTGGILDVDDESRDGTPLKAPTSATIAQAQVSVMQDLLVFSPIASLYAKAGLGYFFNRTGFITLDRLQGYLSIPLGVEGEIALSSQRTLIYGGEYRLFIIGHHLTTATKWGFSEDYTTMQKRGKGARFNLGYRFITRNGGLREMRLIWEYWDIDHGDPLYMLSPQGNKTAIYEPDNTSHRIYLSYMFGF